MKGLFQRARALLIVLASANLAASGQTCTAPVENLGNLGGTFGAAIDATPDLQTIVGVSQIPVTGTSRAFIYSAQRGMRPIPPLAGETWTRSLATAISDNGEFVTGASYFNNTQVAFHPFIYNTETGNTTDLGVPPVGGASHMGTAISSIGHVAFGSDTSQLNVMGAVSWYWTALDGFSVISNSASARPHMGLVRDASRQTSIDQIVAIGDGYAAPGPVNLDRPIAVMWTRAGGVQVVPLGAASSTAMAVSADGTVIVGTMEDPEDPAWWIVYRWTSASGVQILGTSSLSGRSPKIVDMTADGTRVIFRGIPQRLSPEDIRLLEWSVGGGVVDLGPWVDGGYPPNAGAYSRFIAGIHTTGTSMVATLERGQVNRRGDADNDGLPDDWECNGIPYLDASGAERRYVLDVDGDGVSDAIPTYKDLFVEVDAMSGISMPDETATSVRLAFLNAPISNPSGVTGVNLHIVRDETTLAFLQTLVTEANSCWPTAFDVYRVAHFGSTAEHGNTQLLAARAKAFRYCLLANKSGPKEWGGCGHIPGDACVVYAGGMSADDMAAAFMHELGHNLGLEHGGDDVINGKPNYPSIMNYALAYRRDWNQGFWRLDYSRAGRAGESSLDLSFGSIDENTINELGPAGTPTNFYAKYLMPVNVNEVVNGQTARTVRYIPLNGSPIDVGDPGGSGFPDGSFDVVSQDLNYNPGGVAGIPKVPSPGNTFHPHDDWAKVAVTLAPRALLGSFAAAPQIPHDEMTADDLAWIEQNFPIPPTECDSIDFNNDEVFPDAQDIFDFIFVFGSGSCPTCNDIDFNNDGVFPDSADIEAFIRVFGAGSCF